MEKKSFIVASRYNDHFSAFSTKVQLVPFEHPILKATWNLAWLIDVDVEDYMVLYIYVFVYIYILVPA